MADLSCAYRKTLQWCALIYYTKLVWCPLYALSDVVSKSIIECWVEILYTEAMCVRSLFGFDMGAMMIRSCRLAATVRFPAMFIVVGDVQRGICVNICRVLLIWLIGLLNYYNWGWKKQLEPTKLIQEQARKRIRDRMVPETLSDKERLKRRPFCPNIEKT